MKPNLFDRFLLFLLALIIIGAAGALVLMALYLITPDMLAGVCALPYQNWQSGAIAAAIGVVLLLLAVRVLVAFNRRPKKAVPAAVAVSGMTGGSAQISLAAVDSMVQRHCAANPAVQQCKSTVQSREDGVAILLELVLVEDANIPQVVGGLQESLKNYLEGLTGVQVKEIAIMIVSAPVPAKV